MIHSSILHKVFGKQHNILLVASLVFLPFLGAIHLFDWDEINFAEAAREMIVTKDYLRVHINYQPFWEKPPLFIWMQVISMLLLGVGEYAARFPNAVCGIITLVLIFRIGKKEGNTSLGSIWAALYACCWLPHFYFKSGIIDPWFNLFIFLSLYQFYLIGRGATSLKRGILSGIYLGLAVMTKGPVALLLVGLTALIYAVWTGWKTVLRWKAILWMIIFFILTVFLWFGIDAIQNGWWFLKEFLIYQVRLLQTEDAGHGGPFYYHLPVLLVGCFPASIFLFQYFSKNSQSVPVHFSFTRLMWILLCVVLVIFSIVKTKIVHYSSLAYLPLTYLAAQKVYEHLHMGASWNKAVKISLLSVGILLSIVLIVLPIVGKNITSIIPLVEDPFARENMKASIQWSYLESAVGIAYILIIIMTIKYWNNKPIVSINVLLLGQLIVVISAIMIFPKKIEGYSQRAAIEYFKSFQGKDVYVEPLGYKSYAHLFYTNKLPGHPLSHDEEWLLHGAVDKPVYFIAKKHQAAAFIAMPHLEVIGEKNGFVFFERKL